MFFWRFPGYLFSISPTVVSRSKRPFTFREPQNFHLLALARLCVKSIRLLKAALFILLIRTERRSLHSTWKDGGSRISSASMRIISPDHGDFHEGIGLLLSFLIQALWVGQDLNLVLSFETCC